MQNDFISNTECKTQLLQLVAQRQRINLSDIVEQFTVSEATTQCDLENLASQGKVQRVHGGAIAIQSAPLKLSLLEHGHE